MGAGELWDQAEFAAMSVIGMLQQPTCKTHRVANIREVH